MKILNTKKNKQNNIDLLAIKNQIESWSFFIIPVYFTDDENFIDSEIIDSEIFVTQKTCTDIQQEDDNIFKF